MKKKIYYLGFKIKKVNPTELKGKSVYKCNGYKHEYITTLKSSDLLNRFIEVFGDYKVKSVNKNFLFIEESKV